MSGTTAVTYSRLAGDAARGALAFEVAAEHDEQALAVLARVPRA